MTRNKRRKGRRSSNQQRSSKPAPAALGGGPERIQKLLARAGYGSRRACETFISEGRVTVDGQVVSELGAKADPAVHDIRIDGTRLKAESLVYYLLNKPKGVVCTSRDPQRRLTVTDLIPEKRRIFPVGRLDYESRGVVILTNDGRLTNLLTHPRYGIEKTYEVRVRGKTDTDALQRLRQGVWLSEGRTLPARVWVVRERREETVLGIAICEGKNRQVRRMFAKVGNKVLGLTRTRIGPLTLKGIGDGKFRELASQEVAMLTRIAQENAQEPASRQTRSKQSRIRSLGKPDPAILRPSPEGGDPTPHSGR